jgi:hypothetical protein
MIPDAMALPNIIATCVRKYIKHPRSKNDCNIVRIQVKYFEQNSYNMPLKHM